MRGMRRIQSAPANLCQMTHHPNTPSQKTTLATVRPVERPAGESEAVSELVSTVSGQLSVTDPTEQLALLYLIRYAARLDAMPDWRVVLRELCLRLLASFVMHQVSMMSIIAIHAATRSPVCLPQ